MPQTNQHLTKSEQRVRDAFLSHLKVTERKTAKPVMVAMIGLVGSGKSFVARKLAPLLGATIIEHDQIRIGLRKEHLPYDHVAAIAEDTAHAVIEHGGNIIFDADSSDHNGSRWKLKKLSTKPLAEIDTSDPKKCVQKIRRIAQQILSTDG